MPFQKKYKNLAIISDCIHTYNKEGIPCTEVHIFCKQMQELSKHFEQTVIVCPFIEHNAAKAYSLYEEYNISFIPTPPAGGNSIAKKLKLIATIPAWLKAFFKAGKMSDVIYLRFPNNISIPAWFYFTLIRKKRFITYTGSWEKYPGEPFSYRMQRWIIKRLHKDPAFVYTKQKNTRANIFKSFSPSYSFHEWQEEESFVSEKLKALESKNLFSPVFLCIGRISVLKNQKHVLEAFKILHEKKREFHLYLIGSGPEENSCKEFVIKNTLHKHVTFTGSISHEKMKSFYRQAHFTIQTSFTEGYGKVPIEGLFFGTIPISNYVGVASEVIGDNRTGFLFSPDKVGNLVEVLEYVCKEYNQFSQLIIEGRKYALQVTLEKWAKEIVTTINHFYGSN